MFCSRCVNSTRNPTIKIREDGICDVCHRWDRNYNRRVMLRELGWLKNRPAILGMSGGKDSTAMAFMAKKIGINIKSAFTFDIGYYPKHIFPRARDMATIMGIAHECIDIRSYITPDIKTCYELTANVYDVMSMQREASHALYSQNRRAYSVKSTMPRPYIRACQICRKVVIPAYYGEALARDAELVILGMNEWTHLSQPNGTISGIRKLQPTPTSRPVFVVHLPFLLRMTLEHTQNILADLKWYKNPDGEQVVETNGNSCLFAKATEWGAFQFLGFHPDTTRLGREVTAGFLPRQEAQTALNHIHRHDDSVRKVLQNAGIL